MAGRPRSSEDPNATRWRTQPDVEIATSAPAFPSASKDWLPSTRDAFGVYVKSEAARVLRAEDVPDAVRLYTYRDRLARAIAAVDTAEDAGAELKRWQSVRALESMVLTLSTHLGVGPAARARMGVATQRRPGSELRDFLKKGGE